MNKNHVQMTRIRSCKIEAYEIHASNLIIICNLYETAVIFNVKIVANN